MEQQERKPNSSWFVTVRGASHALALHPNSIRKYIKDGTLEAVMVQANPHYTDERIRKTPRGRWRITVESIERLIAHLYEGREVPRGVRRWLKVQRQR